MKDTNKVIIDDINVSECRSFDPVDSGITSDGELVDGSCSAEPVIGDYGSLVGYRACESCHNCLFKLKHRCLKVIRDYRNNPKERNRIIKDFEDYILSICT